MLQAVLREERQLLEFFSQEVSNSDYGYVQDIYDEAQIDDLEETLNGLISPEVYDKLEKNEYVKMVNRLIGIKERKDILSTQIQNNNMKDLTKFMRETNNDKVDLLGSVKSHDDALRSLGISDREYKQFIASQDDVQAQYNTDIINQLKRELNIEDPKNEERDSEVIKIFNDVYQKQVAARLASHAQEDKEWNELGIGKRTNLWDQFEDQRGWDGQALLDQFVYAQPDESSSEEMFRDESTMFGLENELPSEYKDFKDDEYDRD